MQQATELTISNEKKPSLPDFVLYPEQSNLEKLNEIVIRIEKLLSHPNNLLQSHGMTLVSKIDPENISELKKSLENIKESKNIASKWAAYGLGLMTQYQIRIQDAHSKDIEENYLYAASNAEGETPIDILVVLGQFYEQQSCIRKAFDYYSYGAAKQTIKGYYFFAQYCYSLIITLCENKKHQKIQEIKKALFDEYSYSQLYKIVADNYYLVSQENNQDPILALYAQQNLDYLTKHFQRNAEIIQNYDEISEKLKDRRLNESLSFSQNQISMEEYVVIYIWKSKKNGVPISTFSAIVQIDSQHVNIGHASMEIISQKKHFSPLQYYISHWPAKPLDQPLAISSTLMHRSLEDDIEAEEESPDEYIILFGLDVENIIACYHQTCSADYSFKSDEKGQVYNCSTRVFSLLKAGGILKLNPALKEPAIITPNSLIPFLQQARLAEWIHYPEAIKLYQDIVAQLTERAISLKGKIKLKNDNHIALDHQENNPLLTSSAVNDEKGNTPLHNAVESRNPDNVFLVLQTYPGIDINHKNNAGDAAIHIAAEGPERDPDYYHEVNINRIKIAEKNCLKILDLLIIHQANPDCKDKYGRTPLHRAVNVSCMSSIKFLVEHNAKMMLKDGYEKTMLHYIGASQKRVEEITKYLCPINSSQLNQEDICCETPLSVICSKNFSDHPKDKVKVIKIMLQHGASPNVINIDMESPLHLAVRLSEFELVKQLVKHPEHENYINQKNIKGDTALHVALQNLLDLEKVQNSKENAKKITHLLKVIKQLLKYGADPDIQNYENKTPRVLSEGIKISNLEKIFASITVKKTKAVSKINPKTKLLELMESDEIFEKRVKRIRTLCVQAASDEYQILYKKYEKLHWNKFSTKQPSKYYEHLYEKYKHVYILIYNVSFKIEKISSEDRDNLINIQRMISKLLELKLELQTLVVSNFSSEEKKLFKFEQQFIVDTASFLEDVIKRIYNLYKILFLISNLSEYYSIHHAELRSELKAKSRRDSQMVLSKSMVDTLGHSLANTLNSRDPSGATISNNNNNNNAANNNNINKRG